MDLTAFAADVGSDDQVTITGLGTRGGPVPGARVVRAPTGIEWVQPDEMTVCCGAGTPVDDLVAAMAVHGQTIALPSGGTVGGALAVGRSGIRRLGDGPVRDVLLQARYVSAAGQVVKAGGPTVKNVSGFDLCRLLVGSRGTLGFLGEVIMRTRPLPLHSAWFTVATDDPFVVFSALYRPTSVLWDGRRLWALLEGHPDDVGAQAAANGLERCAGPPRLPAGSVRSVPPRRITEQAGEFVAEVGVGIVHHAEACTPPPLGDREQALAVAMRHEFDPRGRLNPAP